MKRLMLVIVLCALCAGCSETANNIKHLKSSFVGLNRIITLYAADGKVIREWTTKANIEDNGGTIYFLDANGKAITVSGTFIVEER